MRIIKRSGFQGLTPNGKMHWSLTGHQEELHKVWTRNWRQIPAGHWNKTGVTESIAAVISIAAPRPCPSSARSSSTPSVALAVWVETHTVIITFVWQAGRPEMIVYAVRHSQWCVNAIFGQLFIMSAAIALQILAVWQARLKSMYLQGHDWDPWSWP